MCLKLTLKQKRFADEYIISGNKTQAAIKAGYSKKTAGVIGDENLKKPYIAEYIEKKLDEIDSEKIADQKEVLEHLTRVLRREEKESVVVTLKKKVSGYVPDDTGKMHRKTIETEEAKIVEIPTKVSDTTKAAELLGKRYGIWTDNLDINADLNLNIKVDYGSND